MKEQIKLEIEIEEDARPGRKLKAKQRSIIKRLCLLGEYTQEDLAIAFDISQSTISRCFTGFYEAR